jgi:hypothetical protein
VGAVIGSRDAQFEREQLIFRWKIEPVPRESRHRTGSAGLFLIAFHLATTNQLGHAINSRCEFPHVLGRGGFNLIEIRKKRFSVRQREDASLED